MTALYFASRAGHTALVRLLLEHGADVHAVDEVGRCGVLLDGHVLYMLNISIPTSIT